MNLKHIFRRLTATDIEALERLSERMTLQAGTELITEGKYNDYLFVIDDGVVRLSKDLEGTSIDIGELSEGEVFGEISFADGAPPSATVSTETEVRLIRLRISAIRELAKAKPEFGANLYHSIAASLATRLREATERFASQAMT